MTLVPHGLFKSQVVNGMAMYYFTNTSFCNVSLKCQLIRTWYLYPPFRIVVKARPGSYTTDNHRMAAIWNVVVAPPKLLAIGKCPKNITWTRKSLWSPYFVSNFHWISLNLPIPPVRPLDSTNFSEANYVYSAIGFPSAQMTAGYE